MSTGRVAHYYGPAGSLKAGFAWSKMDNVIDSKTENLQFIRKGEQYEKG